METLKEAERINYQDIDVEFSIEKLTMQVMESGKRQLTEGMELPTEDKIRTTGLKKTYKYLGILEADTIKQVTKKEKLRKGTSGKPENYSKQNYRAETISKE